MTSSNQANSVKHKPVMPKVEVYRDKYRIRFTHNGKRYTVNTGLLIGEDTLNIAKATCFQISQDIRLGGFDSTLNSYKCNLSPQEILDKKRLFSLWDEFLRHKVKFVHKNTYDVRYLGLERKFKAFFRASDTPYDISVNRVSEFIADEQKRCRNTTIRAEISILSSFWNWMIQSKHCTDNPVKEAKKLMRKQIKNSPSPFTKDEIERILSVFKTDKQFSHYYPLMCFLFSTGCRTGEAIGLRWEKLNYGLKCDSKGTPLSATIDTSLSRNILKDTKTGVSREVPIPPKLGEILASIKPENALPGEFIFKSPLGKKVSLDRVSREIWTKALVKANVPHRKWYNTRHTFISHALDQGINPATVARITGHSVATMYASYAGVIGESKMPDML